MPALPVACALAATAATTMPLRSAPVGVTAAPIAAAAAVVPCWPRITVHVVLPVPPTAVTSRISEPIATEKFGGGKPWSLATTTVVSAGAIAVVSVVPAASRLATAWRTAARAPSMSVGVICVVVDQPLAARRRRRRRPRRRRPLLSADDRPRRRVRSARGRDQKRFGANRHEEVR